MQIDDFIVNREVEYTRNLVNADEISGFEKEMDVSFGSELTQYVLEYGYLAYKHVEFYGIYSNQMLESDMVKQTKYLHKYFPKTLHFVALENVGDGNYVIISAADEVFEYSSEEDFVRDTGLKLFEYIAKRFQEIDE